jgi:hypothetical protein
MERDREKREALCVCSMRSNISIMYVGSAYLLEERSER